MVHMSQSVSASYPRTSAQSESACAYCELGGLVVDGHDRVLGGVDGLRGLPDARRRDRHEQVPHGRLVPYGPHELPHHPEAAAAR